MNEKKDAGEAVVFWICMMLLYFLAGGLQYFYGISLVMWVNILFLLVCIVLVKGKKQGISSLGLTKEHIWSSCRTGLVCSAVIILINGIIPGVLLGKAFQSAEVLVIRLAYYMMIIALPEEIIFRGYIMTRCKAAMDSKKWAIILSGLLFALIHVPYQLVVSGTDIVTFLLNGNGFTIFMTFLWHLVFCLLFEWTQAIYGAVLFHGFMDFSNSIFI